MNCKTCTYLKEYVSMHICKELSRKIQDTYHHPDDEFKIFDIENFYCYLYKTKD